MCVYGLQDLRLKKHKSYCEAECGGGRGTVKNMCCKVFVTGRRTDLVRRSSIQEDIVACIDDDDVFYFLQKQNRSRAPYRRGGVTLKRRYTYRPSVIYLIVNILLSLSLSLSLSSGVFGALDPGL